MSVRTYYLRDRHNVQRKADGTFTRGEPVAVIMTDLDRDNKVIKYAIASAHPNDAFVKSFARQIAQERMKKTDRKSSPKHSGIINIPEEGLANSYEIRRVVMKDLQDNKNIPTRVKKYVNAWFVENEAEA